MNKTNYNEIANEFKLRVQMKQYKYATQGFTMVDGKRMHSPKGIELHTYFQELEALAYTVANNLRDNENFDRDTFLKACGMQKHSNGGWEFLPNREYIERNQRG